MKTIAPFFKEDLKLIKWQILFALFSIFFIITIYIIVDHYEKQSILNLQIAQAGYEQARSREELIEEEEATIIEYIDRYQQLLKDGVIGAADRLQFNETIAEIRAENNLFPVSVTFGKQNRLPLQYNSGVNEPGAPIELDSSTVQLTLDLLHEQDLGRLLRAIFESRGLFQTKECKVSLQNELNTDFTVLDKHLAATCILYWYNFNLNPETEQSDLL